MKHGTYRMRDDEAMILERGEEGKRERGEGRGWVCRGPVGVHESRRPPSLAPPLGRGAVALDGHSIGIIDLILRALWVLIIAYLEQIRPDPKHPK